MAPVAKANVYKVNTNLSTLRTQTRTHSIHECGGYWIELANTKHRKTIIVKFKNREKTIVKIRRIEKAKKNDTCD